MKKRHYRWYAATYRFNEKIDRRLTVTGKAVFLCAFALIFFGLNTRASMLFVVFAIALALLITDALSLMFKKWDFEFERFLPEYASKGIPLKYSVLLRRKFDQKYNEPLFFEEVPANPLPTFAVFESTKEPGEEKRNSFDRKMGYYRWKWLISQNCGGKSGEFAVAGKKTDGGILFDAEFTPERRGRVRFGGAYIFRKGVFGLLKKGKVVENTGDFIVLPKIEDSFEIPENRGGNSNQRNEKIRETQETGSGFELKSLRDFVPGDSIRNIHWKSSAKSGQLRTKEFYRETDSGAALFIDNFFEERYSENFEKILSAAATMLDIFQKEDKMPQIMLIGREIFEIPDSSGKSFAKTLAALALAVNNPDETFDSCLDLLSETAENSPALFFFTTKNDPARREALHLIAGKGTKILVFYAGNDEKIPEDWIKIDFKQGEK